MRLRLLLAFLFPIIVVVCFIFRYLHLGLPHPLLISAPFAIQLVQEHE